MKCLILAAGYATRLYPLTENFPKPLLKVGEKRILDWLIDDIRCTGAVDQFVIISNHKFAGHFEDWAKDKSDVLVLDDGTDSNETRLGAVCDIQFAIDSLKLDDDDLLIIAGDNLLDFSLSSFISYAKQKGTSCTMRYWEDDMKKLQKAGVSVIDEDEKLLSLEEKSQQPKSNWCTPAFYIYKNDDAKKIKTAISEGCGVDAPGSLVSWMCKNSTMYSMRMPGKRYDIGNLESYKHAQESYRGIASERS